MDTIKKVANAILDAGEGCQSGLVYVDPVEAAKAAIAALSTDAEPASYLPAVYRIQRYLHQRSLSRSYNEDVHGFHVGDEAREAILTTLDIEAVIAALSAQVQDVAAWQPIETAPKRQSVIVCCDGIVGEAKWEYFDSADGDADDGWWWANIQSWYGQRIYPTHWMPLPAAPAAKQEGEQ